MCICVNCKHIKKCKTYLFIQKQHQQKIKSNINNPFIPSNTIITININHIKNFSTKLDWDLIECSSFIEKPGYWLE